MKTELQVGNTVKSLFRARWTGILLELVEREKERGIDLSPLATVLVTTDRHGKPMRKPLRMVLSAGWLVKV